MNGKIALVASGGGMSCSYAAGAIYALAKHYGFTEPDFAIAGSGSVGTLAYYTSGQYESIRKVWPNLLSTKKFINKLRFWKVVDVDYLIDYVFKVLHPLDRQKVYDSPVTFLIAVTDFYTGGLEYISNKDKEDIFDVLRASKAMPIAFNKKVIIGDSAYCDTYLSSSLKAHIKKACELGCAHMIVIDNDMRRRFNKSLFDAWLKTRSSSFKRNYKDQMDEIDGFSVPEDINIIRVRPHILRVGTLHINQALLNEAIQMGWDDVVKNNQLQDLFS